MTAKFESMTSKGHWYSRNPKAIPHDEGKNLSPVLHSLVVSWKTFRDLQTLMSINGASGEGAEKDEVDEGISFKLLDWSPDTLWIELKEELITATWAL